MGLKITCKYPVSLTGGGKIKEIQDAKPDILREAGESLKACLEDWMRQLNSIPNKNGWPRSNHWTPKGVHAPIVDGDTVSVPIHNAGITRALHDVVISPVEAKSLAIPAHADAYGLQPREYNQRHPKGTELALFRPKGKNYLARRGEDGELVVMYHLTKQVTQPQNRDSLPPDEQMNEAFSGTVHDAIEAILSV